MENRNDLSEDELRDAEPLAVDGEPSVSENEGEKETADGDGAEKKPSEYEPKNKYEKLLFKVYRDETLAETCRITSYALVALTVYAFFMRIVGLAESPIEIVKLLLVCGVPFAAVSVLRRVINAPRPYELFEFYDKKPKSKAGRSFPSRHVFSMFVIATALLSWEPAVGVALMLGGALLAFLRVALGIHFVRDVVAGALIGLASGGIGLLVLNFI